MSLKMTIDGREVEAGSGQTVLEAASKAGVDIPTMCFGEGYGHISSCMLCVVQDMKSGRLLPSCSVPVMDGMDLETDNDVVRESRQAALELLLSEHVGDCEGPCRMLCPAGMDIPLMIRQILEGKLTEAIATVKRDIPFPAVLGRICSAPCEKGCRRRDHDSPVAICLLKRFVADVDIATGLAYMPMKKPDSDKTVAVVGAGPAGLTAAYYLSVEGHACTIIDDRDEPGGGMRYQVSREVLPADVLDAEIDIVRRLGTEFRLTTRVGRDVRFSELCDEFDAVVVATGEAPPAFPASRPDVFPAFHDRPLRMAVRALAYGKEAAFRAGQFLRGEEVTGRTKLFNSRIGKLREGEIGQFLAGADRSARVEPEDDQAGGFTGNEADREAGRCLRCDCLKKDACKLRDYAQAYDASPRRYRSDERRTVEKIRQHADVIYEPGKCISCGLCVRITEKAGEKLGLTFLGRGFDVRVGVPFDLSLADALEKTAGQCVRACPTGALASRGSGS